MDFVDEGKKTVKKKKSTKKVVEKTDEGKVEHLVVEPVVVKTEDSIFSGGTILALALVVGILFYNQLLLFELATYAGAPDTLKTVTNVIPGGSSSSLSLADGEKVIYGPALLAAGEQPSIAGYRTKMKEFPTVSGRQKKAKTGDAVQDAVNMMVPTGTPEYGREIGVSFDDPVNSLNRLGELENTVSLTPVQEKRWSKIVGAYTCDFCCGAPQQPTIINRCGCAHAAGWRGISKYLIAKYDTKVSDEQIMGEMTKWKALWYPGPMVQRLIQEQSAGGTASGPVKLDALPQMVGGC